MEVTDTIWQGEKISRHYLDGVRGAIPLAQEQIEVMLRLIQFSQQSVTAVLDLGCGDGILGQAVLDQFPEASGTFVDFSEPMLAAAKERLGPYQERVMIIMRDYGKRDWRLTAFSREIGNGVANQISNPQSPIANLFDVIVSGYSIHHQPDGRKKEIYAELYGLLKPGGIFINTEHVASRSKWGEMMFEEVLVEAMVAYHNQIGSQQTRAKITHDTVNRADKAANRLTAVETQCDWLRNIGFIHVDCYLKYFELAVFAGVKPF